MTQFEFISNSEEETRRFGAALAATLTGGTTVALIGTLGAGKTRLVQAVAAGLDVPPDSVVSPTFVLCQHYPGRLTLYHMDAYRLKDDDEFLQLGPEEYFESDGVTMVEWADRVAACLPEDYLQVTIEPAGVSKRVFELAAVGEGLQGVVDAVERILKNPA